MDWGWLAFNLCLACIGWNVGGIAARYSHGEPFGTEALWLAVLIPLAIAIKLGTA